jgi:hypothetical protein
MDDINAGGGRVENTPGRSTTDSVRPIDDALGGPVREAPWNEGERAGNSGTTGPITDDYADIGNPGTTTIDEEFAGTRGTPGAG